MNKNIKLAVAGAILATASVANAGIIIPAGDWTLDVSGNVNAYTSWVKGSGDAVITGGLTTITTATGNKNTDNRWGNGLLPNFLSFSGSTRQNDLDVTFLISLQPGSATNAALTDATASNTNNGGLNNRQAFITFGDKSWGSIKMGKDLGIFASDAILSDMTLLGVGAGGAGAAAGALNTSLGRIGTGYIYTDWKPQIAYTTPNMSGFQATVGISQAYVASSAGLTTSSGQNAAPAYEGKASYAFNTNGVDGKVWVSGIAQKQSTFTVGNEDPTAYAGDIGATLNAAGFGLTGYYYSGNGVGTTGQMLQGYAVGTSGKAVARDSDGGYVQATYVLPTKTKVGVSWGISNLDRAGTDSATGTLVKSNEMWTAGLYHPLTKHLNLVGEYSYVRAENQAGASNNDNIGSVGAILFF